MQVVLLVLVEDCWAVQHGQEVRCQEHVKNMIWLKHVELILHRFLFLARGQSLQRLKPTNRRRRRLSWPDPIACLNRLPAVVAFLRQIFQVLQTVSTVQLTLFAILHGTMVDGLGFLASVLYGWVL